jgi:hypothetical protein
VVRRGSLVNCCAVQHTDSTCSTNLSIDMAASETPPRYLFTLCIVRHGETTANKAGIIQGQSLDPSYGRQVARRCCRHRNELGHGHEHEQETDKPRITTTITTATTTTTTTTINTATNITTTATIITSADAARGVSGDHWGQGVVITALVAGLLK